MIESRLHVPLLVALLALTCPRPASAQDQDAGACWLRDATVEEAGQRISPLGVVAIPLGDAEATLCYSRPSARDRTVMGELVPYGGVPWRLGANEATAIHLPFAASIGGVEVEPGSYSLSAIAGESEWEIVVNRRYQRWGIPLDEAVRSEDVGSFTRPVTATDAHVETLTIAWRPHGDAMGHLVVSWEGTRVEIPVRRTDG